MGIAIPQVITPSKASGAQVIDGSLRFDGSSTHLERTPSSASNRKTWTWSSWIKRSAFGANERVFQARDANTGNQTFIQFRTDNKMYVGGNSDVFLVNTNRVFRDIGWGHLVISFDTTQSTSSNRIRIYWNGDLTDLSGTQPTQDYSTSQINNTFVHAIGEDSGGGSEHFEGSLSNAYLIDGQALDASYFGFTDPLTNTWKPKKYTGTFGTNGFYLPMDGNSPIGQDKSGNGNDFTPVNFGGSVALDSPAVSGARPFLNTTQGGTQATVGVFGSRENVGYAVTVYNDGGGNKYYIDGVKQDTVTGLIRGATYTFDTSDSTVSSHPFRFSATSNGSHGGGSEYTNGVAAITGAATTITVPHDAPNTLYYYCTSHSGMGADITGITTNEKLADQYASNCVLAVSFSGGRYQDDSSLLNCTTAYNSVSSEGNINSGISTISNFYATSLYFDGSGDYYTTPSSNTSELGMGTGDFTIETWIYPTALGTDFIVNLTAVDSVFGYNSDGTLNIQLPSSGAPSLTQLGPKIVANKWNHFAVVRESGAVRGYVDGVLAATVTDTTNMGSTGKAVIGSHATLSREITGYLQDLRIYKGIAKYTSDFVVPATSPDVLPDTPSGTSGGSKLAKITDGAVRFDGTGDLLSVSDSDDFHLGTNDFTIEYFVYKNSTQGTNSHHVSQYGTSNANRSFAFRSVALPFTDLQFRWYNGSNEYTMNWSEGWMRAQEGWKHICVQRKSGDMYLYIDGKLWKTETGSSAALSINNSTAPLTIGGDSNTGSEYYLKGSISNFRFINGTAIYRTGGFAPPSAPLTNVTNTKLLTCQSTILYAAVAPLVSGVNNGTVWSSSLTADSLFRSSSYPAKDAFNGVTKTSTEDCAATPQVAGQGFTFLFGGGVPFTTLQMQCDHNNGATVTANGVNITSQLSSGSLTNTTITGVTSPLTSLSVVSHNGDAGYLGSVTIDGTMLVDPFVPNGDTAATNFNPFNTDINTVRGQETGYATFNPLDSGHDGASITFSDGNLKAAFPSTSGTGQAPASIYVSSGKWYCEYYLESVSDLTSVQYGIVSPGSKRASYIGKSDTTDQYGWEPEIDRAYNDGTNTTPTGKTFTSQWSVAAMALDLDAGTWEMFIDGIPTGTIYSNISGTYTFAVGDTMSSGYHTHTANFGQKPFKFSPPDGFQPLNTANARPVKVISRPDQYVGISTWTGDSAASRNIDIGIKKPDLVWLKNRFVDGRSNYLYDSVRGFGANKEIVSNTSDEEGSTNHQTQNHGYVSGNMINGFTLTAGATNSNYTNQSGQSYVGWAWKAGGNKNTFNVDDVGYASASDINMSASSLNSATYNTSNRWSDDYSGATIDSSYPITQAFDGNRTTASRVSATQTAMSVDLTNITVIDKIEVRGERGYITPYVSVTVGGTTHQIGGDPNTLISGSAGTTSRVITGVSGALTNVTVGRVNSGRTFLSQIIVDGKILVDDNITPPNAPSIAATGASVGTKQGFSIIKYDGNGTAGSSIPHGLLQSPEFVIVKDTDDTDNWQIYHAGAQTSGGAKLLKFTTDKATTNDGPWHDTPPSSTTITLGGGGTNDSGNTHICYAWHDVPGLQKFGSYESGGGTYDGPYIELGFKPAMVMVKAATRTYGSNWSIIDAERNNGNFSTSGSGTKITYWSTNDDEFTSGGAQLDILSNGFKVRNNSSDINDGGTYIYAAWAEAPSIDLFGGGANAR